MLIPHRIDSCHAWLKHLFEVSADVKSLENSCVIFFNDFFSTSIWTIWRIRNKKIFWWRTFDWVSCLEFCRFDWVWWVKAEYSEQVPTVADLIRNQGSIDVPKKPRKFKTSWVWKPYNIGFIKVIVGGSFLGSSGREDIGGVFRDSKGKVIL